MKRQPIMSSPFEGECWRPRTACQAAQIPSDEEAREGDEYLPIGCRRAPMGEVRNAGTMMSARSTQQATFGPGPAKHPTRMAMAIAVRSAEPVKNVTAGRSGHADQKQLHIGDA